MGFPKNMKKKILSLTLLLLTTCALAFAQSGGLLNGTRGFPQPNDGTTGTVLNQTAKINSAGQAIQAGVADTTVPVYIVIGGAGTTGNAVLAAPGTIAACQMDATVAANGGGYFILQSTITAGDCHPQASAPAQSTWVLGYLAQATTSSGSNALVSVNGFVYAGTGSSGGISGLTSNYLPKATGSTSIANSLLSDNGTSAGYSGTGGFSALLYDQGGMGWNVKASNYGAKCDGTTDDTSALQAAINAALAGTFGGTVYLPPGKCKETGLTANLTNGQGFALVGAGPAGGGPGTGAGSLATSYLWHTGTDTTALTVGTEGTYNYNGPIIRNVGFHEVNAGTSAGAIKLINQSYYEIDHVMVEGFSKTGLAAPSAPSISATTGGSLSAGTYYVTVAYVNPEGETLDSSTSSVAVSSSGKITGSSPSASGNATCYRVYAGTSASSLHLQNLSTGCVTLGTGFSISTLTTNSQSPLNYDESGAFGLNPYGTMSGFGVAGAFVNQPEIIDFNTTGGTYNGIVADRSVSYPYIFGANLNDGSATSGCGAILTGPSEVFLHAENGGTGRWHFCLQGFALKASLGVEDGTSASVGGVKAVGLIRSDIHVACSGISGAGKPVNLDSGSYNNWIWVRSNTTCANPMITDAGHNNNKWSDETTPGTMNFGGPIQVLGSTVPLVIASGQTALGTASISSGVCTTAVTVSATGVLTSDTVLASYSGDPSGTTGFGVSATGAVLSIYAYPGANQVNFKVCNSTANPITPGSLTVNWEVLR